MSDFILCTGDPVLFTPAFGKAIVTVLGPVTIAGSGQFTINGKPVCVLGDERKVEASATYVNPPYVQPGTGTVKIGALMPAHLDPRCISGKPVLLKGQTFTAVFMAKVAAMNAQQTLDPQAALPMVGTGSFPMCQLFVRAG